jgi:hypothetical protein
MAARIIEDILFGGFGTRIDILTKEKPVKTRV